ncbi:hypothetical protein CDD80_5897 [Ophiocordyceps camponoti-rufipedis]|uniref:NADH-cytochrome b5 reductase n=1 Tax=Ophiocordyceps camponoti-rufipedis TaxID=2004952 RepID=A0A2C5YTD2_9HYPO|nr:hypothetical protein CDD80_5897 [Ophiocordyceps camponoti-rufipedis]
MFARSAFRAARPLKTHARRYATDPNPPTPSPPKKHPTLDEINKKGPSSGWISFAAATLAAGGCYWLVFGSSTPSPAQQAAAQAKLAAGAGTTSKAALTGGDQGFVPLKLAGVETVNHNTKKFRFELPEGDMVSGLHVASAVLTRFKGEGEEKATVRPYTPVSDEDEKGHLDLLVKKYPNGPMSTHLHEMQPGQTLDFKGPLPKYPWTENKHQHIGLIAGGTGITPMYQLLRAILQNPRDKTKVTLVFGNVSEADILLRKELNELENTYPQRFRAFYIVDEPPETKAEWRGATGFITKELLRDVLPEPKEGDVKVFVCGPPGLMKAISGAKTSPKDQGELTGALKELGYEKEQVYKF